MSSANGTKFSFSFGGGATANGNGNGNSTSKGGPSTMPAPAPKSNLEMLMARAGGKPGSSTSGSTKKAPASLFADDDDEPATAAAPARALLSSQAGPSRPTAKSTTTATPTIKQSSLISRAERKAQEAALAIDQNVFDYDSVYDSMKTAERAAESAKKAESADRKPKYMDSFRASAETRKLDRLRAEEKMLSLEREKEGDEFQDKEKFVTEAYKRQMEDVRKAEAEEKAREEAIRKGKKGPGLTAFYKSMLDTDEAKHAAAVAATSGATGSGSGSGSGAGPSLAIRPPTSTTISYDDEEEFDPFLAQEAKQAKTARSAAGSSKLDEETGKEVEINDEGEVVDKRSLLKAGLNIMKKPASNLPNSILTSQRNGGLADGPYKSRAVGTAASYTERMERERKRLADQMREDAEKKRREAEEARRKEEEEARKRKEGDDGEAERKRREAKERYLARKRALEEEKSQSSKKAKEE